MENTPVYTESDLLPLSALQHITHCKRRCALTHIEQTWEDNKYTAEGNLFHDHVHEQGSESRPGIRTVRGLRIRSLILGLSGIADVVEFYQDSNGCIVPGLIGKWKVFPVEYKRGAAKFEHAYEIQLCAQALCLEEMLTVKISKGALYFGAHHKRREIPFTDDLIRETTLLAAELHFLIENGKTPLPVYNKRCHLCSLMDKCMPTLQKNGAHVDDYINAIFEDR